MRRYALIPAVMLVATGLLAGPAAAQDPYGQVLNVLPPGNNGNVNAQDLFTLGPGKAAGDPASLLGGLADPQSYFTRATATSPRSFADQLETYDALNAAQPSSLRDSDLTRYFKNADLGVDPADVVRTETPRPGVTIVWDTRDVPHITGVTDADVAYGAGVAVMETRMFLTDVLRHTGAATMSTFVGPTDADLAQDAAQLQVAPYTEEQIAQQLADFAKTSPEAARLQGAFDAYIDGINATQRKLCPATTASVPLPGNLGLGFGVDCPVEYAALQRPPAPYTRADIVSIASLVGGIFGTGGGGQYTNAIWLQQLQEKLGKTEGRKVYDDLRSKNDPEAPVTTEVPFAYGNAGGIDPDQPGVALPDLHPKATQLGTGAIINDDGSLSPPPSGAAGNHGNGSTTDPKPRARATGPVVPDPLVQRYGVNPRLEARRIRGSLERALSGELVGMSNALLVDAKHSASGHPTVVFGPQTGYYAPQLLMEQELRGPHTAARGVSFAGTNFIVSLGRGVDYAWSATSPYTDITDVVVQKLCNADGSPPTVDSTSYRDDAGTCVPMVQYAHTQTAFPTLAAGAPPRQIKLLVLRTDHGVVRLRSTVKGEPVSISTQRSTYMHESESVLGFLKLNDPGFVTDAKKFQEAVSLVQYTFNWYYADDRDIAYYSSAKLPVRAPGTDLDLPRWGGKKYDWRGFAPYAAHPNVLNPTTGVLVNWNNKLAPGFAAASQVWGQGSVYRVQSLTDRLLPLLARKKATSADLVGVMIDAATVDVRGAQVLPEVLDVVGAPADPQQAEAVRLLRAWIADGAHRVDRDRTGGYEHQAAIALLDTWWDPEDAEASCGSACGFSLPKDAMRFGLGEDVDILPEPLDDHPSGHIGSAWNGISWYGYLDKDLRSTLGRPVKGAYSRSYCGPLADCRAALRASLSKAIAATLATQKQTTVGDLTYDKARDTIISVPAGVVGTRAIDWQNRPTFQQVVAFTSHRARPVLAAPKPTGVLAATGLGDATPLVGLLLLAGAVAVHRRRRA